MVLDPDSVLRTSVHAAVSDTAAACLGHLYAVNRTLVAGYWQHLDNVSAFALIHGELDPLIHNGTLLVNTAAHRGQGAGNYGFRNFEKSLFQSVFKGKPCHFAQNFVFKLLHTGIKHHCISFLSKYISDFIYACTP